MSTVKAPGTILEPQQAISNRPPMGAGIQVIWGPPEADNNPLVKSIQGIYRWDQVEPQEGVYDWRRLHADLKRSYDLNKPIMLQINCPAPAWIAKYVAVLGTSRGGYAYQYWDPLYMGFHRDVLQKFAEQINGSDYKHMVIGVRVQPNAYNTEYFVFEPAEFDGKIPVEDDRRTWQSVPVDGGYQFGRTDFVPGTTDNYGVWYMKQVQQWCIDFFQTIGIKTAFRTLLNQKHIAQPLYIEQLFNTPGAMVLDTRCGLNMADGMRNRYELIRNRCRDGKLLGYWEDSQYEWDGHTWQQNIYWRNLIRLDAGVQYLAVYAKHIEFNQSFAFANKYAGWYRFPATSPGAWIAFHNSRVTGNLGYFLQHVNTLDGTILTDYDTGIYGAWALQVKAGRRVTLSIDSRFFDSIRGRKVNVRIVYYATGAVMRLNNNAGTFGALLNNWHETVIPSLVLAAPSLEISVNSGTAILHMVEIIKL